MSLKPAFQLGQLVATPGAVDLMYASEVTPASLIDRHLAGDWGDLGTEDKRANTHALTSGLRIFSAYKVGKGKVWVITESDRSATTMLLPEEY